MSQNRLWNAKNPHQGNWKRVLCVCSAGLLRSPTLAWVLSNPPFNFNTRAVGLSAGHALIQIDEVLVEWADIIVIVEHTMIDELSKRFKLGEKLVVGLSIPDYYAYRDPELIRIIEEQLHEWGVLQLNV